MTRLTAVIMIVIGGSVGGCGTTYSPIYQEAIGSSGEITESIAGHTSDASVAKEQAVMAAYKYRDRMYKDMYLQSGFNMEFALVEVAPGIMAYMPTSISYREEPDFNQPLPEGPSEHPVWKTTESIFGTVAKYGLLGWGISEFSGVLKAGFDAAGSSYAGPVNMENSFNTAGHGQNFTGASQYQGEGGINSEGEEGGEESCWVSPGCSCESAAEGRCS